MIKLVLTGMIICVVVPAWRKYILAKASLFIEIFHFFISGDAHGTCTTGAARGSL